MHFSIASPSSVHGAAADVTIRRVAERPPACPVALRLVQARPAPYPRYGGKTRLALDAPGSGVPQYGQLAMADQERIQKEAQRLQRSMSWVVQRAWKHARKEIKGIPGSNEPGG
jgi:uncharacterized small protein (TIGR04563 family)